jgi:3,4-dihydroxy-2-butanone 4-phosphate synthase
LGERLSLHREGGVLKRAGHTEAYVDLAILARLPLVAVLYEIVDDADGSVACLPKLRVFAESRHGESKSLQYYFTSVEFDCVRYYCLYNT